MVITGSNLNEHSLVYLDYNLSQDIELFLSGNTSCIFSPCHAEHLMYCTPPQFYPVSLQHDSYKYYLSMMGN